MSQAPSRFPLLDKMFQEQIKRRALFLIKVDRRIKWLGAGMFCFALFGILSYFPEATEKYYSRGIFVGVRYLYDYTLGMLPFSSTIWLNMVLSLWLLFKIFKYIRFNFTNREVSPLNRFKYSALALGSLLGKISVIFFVGWGFNYNRTAIEDQIGIEIKSLTSAEVAMEANLARKRCVDVRRKIPNLPMDKPFDASYLPLELEEEMRSNLATVLERLGYLAPGRPRCRRINSDFWLQETGYTGVYVSFYGEALVGARIKAVYQPFFFAHELAHAYGFFDEADANFLAYLACEASDDPAVVYSGRLAHLLYIMSELNILDYDFPPSVRTDLLLNGLVIGEEEYNRMILLVRAWRLKYGK